MTYWYKVICSLGLGMLLHIAVLGQDVFDFQPLIARHFSAEEQAKAATGLAAATYLSPAEQKTISFANLARMFPQQFAALYIDWLHEDDDEELLEKFEAGDPFYATLHRDLLKMKPLPPLVASKKYWKCARFWAKYSAKHDLMGHNRPWYPIKCLAEVCDYNFTNDPMMMVMDLLVDEKIKSLGHRRILLGKWLQVGASLVPHPRFGYCLVMDFGE